VIPPTVRAPAMGGADLTAARRGVRRFARPDAILVGDASSTPD
jgi:hypothetical protein